MSFLVSFGVDNLHETNCMNKILLLLLSVCFTVQVIGQEQRKFKESVSAQLNGPGLVGIPLVGSGFSFLGGGVRYDRVYKKNENTYLGFAVEANGHAFWGAEGLSLGPDFVLLKGRDKHFFELDVGPRFITAFDDGSIPSVNFNLGYRFEAEKVPFVLRVGTGYSNWLFLSLGGRLRSSNIKSKAERKQQSLGLSVGTNLFTPFEYYFDNYDSELSAYDFVSNNQSISLHVELTKGRGSLLATSRIPLMLIDPDDDILLGRPVYGNPYVENGSEINNCKFEIGLKPRYYFMEGTKKIQAFAEAGVYFGRRTHFLIELTEHFYYDPSNDAYYSVNQELWSSSLKEGPIKSYLRFSLGTGVKYNISKKISVDLEAEFFGTKRTFYSTRYMMVETDNGEHVEIRDKVSTRNQIGYQFGLNLNYHFMR